MPAPKLDQICADAVDLARAAVVEEAGADSVGEHLGVRVEGDRLVSHLFASTHPGYSGWHWSVTVARASRAKAATVDEVVLLPGDAALLAPRWIPWQDRIEAGDVQPGVLMPTPVDDPRLEPGYTGGEQAADPDPAEASLARAVVAELGLGRERVLSKEGRDETVERWLTGSHGPNDEATRQSDAPCSSCGFFVRLQGNLGTMFGACTNLYTPFDGQVVSFDHGCTGHSDVVAEERASDLPAPVWETVAMSEGSLFD